MKAKGKRLFFLKEENLNKIKKPAKKDTVILLDENPRNRNYKTLKRYLQQLSDETSQTIAGYNVLWIQRWAFKKLQNNKSFTEELVFNGISLWYFIEFLFHRMDLTEIKDPIQQAEDIPASKILIYIDCIYKIIKKMKPSEIVIENAQTEFNQLVLKICRKEKIKLINLKFKKTKRKIKSIMLNNLFLTRSYLKARIFIRKVISKTFCKRSSHKPILILTNTRLSNKNNSTDFFWGPFIKELEKRKISYKVIEYDQINILDSLKKVIKRYIPQKYDTQFIGTYYDSETTKTAKAVVNFLKNKFRELDKREDFKYSLTYKGINFYELVRRRLQKIFLAYAPYIGDVYALGKSAVEKEKPKIVLIDHEENYFGKSLLFEANKQKIYSISMENEVLYARRTKFIHEPIKIILNKRSPLWRPIADKKFVHGEYSRRWYNEKDFIPLQNLKVIGSPKYDFLRKITKQDKENLFKKYDVKPNERLVTVITATLLWENQYIDSVVRALKDFKNISIIIKQHPEDPDINQKIIKKIIKKYGVKGKVTKDENTSLLFYASDFIVTYNSTSINECILLNKNVILFEPGEDIGWSWVEEGLIKPHATFAQLEKEIKRLLNKKNLISKKAGRKYIKKYFYSDDGKASERAVKEIEKVI